MCQDPTRSKWGRVVWGSAGGKTQFETINRRRRFYRQWKNAGARYDPASGRVRVENYRGKLVGEPLLSTLATFVRRDELVAFLAKIHTSTMTGEVGSWTCDTASNYDIFTLSDWFQDHQPEGLVHLVIRAWYDYQTTVVDAE